MPDQTKPAQPACWDPAKDRTIDDTAAHPSHWDPAGWERNDETLRAMAYFIKLATEQNKAGRIKGFKSSIDSVIEGLDVLVMGPGPNVGLDVAPETRCDDE